MNPSQVKSVLEQSLALRVTGPHAYNAFLLVHHERQNIHWELSAGSSHGMATEPGESWHTASIGKTFTAVIIMQLAERGRLNLDDSLSRYLPAALLQGLHVYKGKDYTDQITLEQLLSHTSGLPDFYEDKPRSGKYFLQVLLEEPNRRWTPEETIEWTKAHMTPVSRPGKKFHYTDTGYNLLGLVSEKVTGLRYHEALREYLFAPLKMQHTYLLHYNTPAVWAPGRVANLILGGREIDVEDYPSLSGIFAAGQTVSTSGDLLLFMQALVAGKVVSAASLEKMMTWKGRRYGVDYGMGLMRVKMWPFTRRYDVWGHLGSVGSFMLYNPHQDVYIAGTFNRSGYLGRALRFLLGKVLYPLEKMKS
ncbi:serine hydrolase domain-containing protein [Chitinophaga varians]|uniref:serine hydrolase domain-containing protein n=1 Tax=Chitinophaga varians TaxID=2202339 RepID=UPI00165FCF1A|nr:serine hydrolase domain-containing protein [Chitinophaga varians]MBC9911837.1 beta-lactamase family protein [Chitinophaga varians]